MAPNGPRNSSINPAPGLYPRGVCKSNITGTPEEQAKRALKILKRIEEAGGSKAFEAWCKQTDFGRKQIASRRHVDRGVSLAVHSTRADLQLDGALVHIYSILFYTHIDVNLPQVNMSGSGGAWGFGFGGLSGAGALIMNNAQDVQTWSQSVTGFQIGAGGDFVGGAEVVFFSDSNVVGGIAVAGVGLIAAVGFGGGFSFSAS